MAGTLFGLALSQQHDATASRSRRQALHLRGRHANAACRPTGISGCPPARSIRTRSCSTLRGRVPAFWLADGTARARLTDRRRRRAFRLDEYAGARPFVGRGGGGGDTTNPNAIFKVGDFQWQPVSGTRAGWVRANGAHHRLGHPRARASARMPIAKSLFTHLWNTYSDTICPVVSGRGASAAADWAANKQIDDSRRRGARRNGRRRHGQCRGPPASMRRCVRHRLADRGRVGRAASTGTRSPQPELPAHPPQRHESPKARSSVPATPLLPPDGGPVRQA